MFTLYDQLTWQESVPPLPTLSTSPTDIAPSGDSSGASHERGTGSNSNEGYPIDNKIHFSHPVQ